MGRHNLIKGWRATVLMLALAVLGSLGVGCGADGGPTPTLAQLKALDVSPTDLPPEPSATALATALPAEPASTPTPSPVSISTAIPSPEPDAAIASWHPADAMALIVSGDHEQADLYALDADGAIRVLFSGVGNEVRVSPDGRWLGFVSWSQDGRGKLELHDAQSGESTQIAPDTTSGLLRFSFDRAGERLAFLDLGAYGDVGVPWALVVVDVESGAGTRYEGLMAGSETRPLPGAPVAWSGGAAPADELIIDTFLPYTEGGAMGVWGVTLPADGAPAALDTLQLRELIPGTPVYSSRLFVAPDASAVAYLGRDPDYTPAGYAPEFFDLAVNRLGLARLDDGARAMLVEVADGSALARALAWSPTGERLLFAQGRFEGEEFAALALQSTDMEGTVVGYGPLSLPPLGGLLDLAWCDPSLALYLVWDGSDGTQHLLTHNLHTGVSTEVGAGQRLEIVGCAR